MTKDNRRTRNSPKMYGFSSAWTYVVFSTILRPFHLLDYKENTRYGTALTGTDHKHGYHTISRASPGPSGNQFVPGHMQDDVHTRASSSKTNNSVIVVHWDVSRVGPSYQPPCFPESCGLTIVWCVALQLHDAPLLSSMAIGNRLPPEV